MMSSNHIIEVSEASFQAEVLAFSNQKPVIVDFWAEWCQPCHLLNPLLEKLTTEANGKYRLAKVNADENPNLTGQLKVIGLPTVKAFHRGQIVAEFTGEQTELQVREFLRNLTPTANSLGVEKGNSLFSIQKWEAAEAAYRAVLKSNPDDSLALLGLAKSLMVQGDAKDALPILRAFPASNQYTAAETLMPAAKILTKHKLDELNINDEDEYGSMYLQSLKLIGLGNLAAAADGILDILRENKTYRDGEARQLMVAILEMMGTDNPETRVYRNELASVLF
ncbi:MAG: tetratricopeptide repeat protein [Chloroflexota bacterium]